MYTVTVKNSNGSVSTKKFVSYEAAEDMFLSFPVETDVTICNDKDSFDKDIESAFEKIQKGTK